jgi:uncharacterized membrane protein YphA (DoxX/SURF4 family)
MEEAEKRAGGHACGFESAIRGRLRRCSFAQLAVLPCSLVVASLPGLAHAHVRWFTHAAEDSAAPEPLTALMASPLFVTLLVLAIAVIAWVRSVDVRLAAGNCRFMHVQRRIDSRMSARAAPVLRFGIALFFVSIALYFRHDPITLTPELKSPTSWVVPLQIAIAGAMLFRAGVIPACAGMVLLYAYSIHLYGTVHLLDYHLFLGVCVFLCLDRFSQRLGAGQGLLVLRLLVSTSFMWVGIEKWLYPEWTCDILEHQLPMLTMGMDPDSWATGAGFVEVALAFLMLFGGASSQVAAAVLLVVMSAAIPLVGAVDAIGHLPMVFSLIVLATTRNRLPRWLHEHAAWQPSDLGNAFVLGVTGLTGLYYLAHEFAPALQTRLVEIWPDVLLAGAAVMALVAWVTRMLLRNSSSPQHARPADGT